MHAVGFTLFIVNSAAAADRRQRVSRLIALCGSNMYFLTMKLPAFPATAAAAAAAHRSVKHQSNPTFVILSFGNTL